MPKKANVIKVVKEPLDAMSKRDFSKNFEKLPRLYLELLENKKKIEPALSTKEFVPDYENYKSDSDSVNSNASEDVNDNDFRIPTNKLEKFRNPDSTHKENFRREIPDNRSLDDDNNSVSSEEYDFHQNAPSAEDELTNQLKSLLSDDEEEYIADNNSLSTSSTLSPSPARSHRSTRRTPPTLDQLKYSGMYKPPVQEIPAMTDEDEEDKKRELLFKFELLKKSYKNTSEIPEFSIHSDYEEMKRAYDHSVRKLSLETSVENYKTYLIGGFMLIEYIFGNWFKFEMQGFTQQQILSMNSYEKLLIELGEKSYVPENKQWPVEVRLLFLIIINAAVFIVSKMILNKTGSNLMNMFNSMNTAGTSSGSNQAPKPKRKMRGPNINLNEIPEYESD
jgi:hypothetical protein